MILINQVLSSPTPADIGKGAFINDVIQICTMKVSYKELMIKCYTRHIKLVKIVLFPSIFAIFLVFWSQNSQNYEQQIQNINRTRAECL
jgi:hypothetical protein